MIFLHRLSVAFFIGVVLILIIQVFQKENEYVRNWLFALYVLLSAFFVACLMPPKTCM
jgi:hypothetical protein